MIMDVYRVELVDFLYGGDIGIIEPLENFAYEIEEN